MDQDSASEDEFSPWEDLIPQGVLPSCGFRVISYVTPQGGIGFRFDQAGETAVTNLIGLLEMCKHDIATLANGYSRSVVNDDDDD